MTVEELMKLLATQPKNRKVFVRNYQGKMREAVDGREQFESVGSTEKHFMIFPSE